MRLLLAVFVICLLLTGWGCTKSSSSSIAKQKLYRVEFPQADYPLGHSDIYGYDAQGRLSSIISYVGSVVGNRDSFYYDSFGRLSSFVSSTDGQPFIQRHLFTYATSNEIKSTETRAVRIEAQGSMGGPFETYSASDIFYDDANRTQTFALYYPGGKTYGRTVLTRDNEGNITNATYIYTDTIQGIDLPIWSADYTYDAGRTPFEGMSSLIFYRCIDGYENFQYTQPHNVLTRYATAFTSNSVSPVTTSFKYEFNGLGYPVTKTIDDGTSNVVIETYEYR